MGTEMIVMRIPDAKLNQQGWIQCVHNLSECAEASQMSKVVQMQLPQSRCCAKML